MALFFDGHGELVQEEVVTYRTPLTVTDIMIAARKVGYSDDAKLMWELGLDGAQHGLPTRADNSYGDRLRWEHGLFSGREREIIALQRKARLVAHATYRVDLARKVGQLDTANPENRLATDTEVLQYLILNSQLEPRRANAATKQSPGVSLPNDSVGADGLIGTGFLGPATLNAYGPGINSDATGRPFYWRPDFGGPALGPITPNAYGPGVGMDGTGRAVRPSCLPGMTMC